MALTFYRWTALATGGALAISAYMLAPTEVRPRVRGERDRLERLEQQRLAAAARAADQLVILQLRADALKRVATTAADSVRVYYDPAIPAPARERLVALTRRARMVTQADAGRPQPMDIAFLVDTTRTVRGVPRAGRNTVVDYALPARAGERCVVLARARNLDALASGSALSPGLLLGPCAYLATFGTPGPHIERWLLERGWQLGEHADWTRPMPAWATTANRRSRFSFTEDPGMRRFMGIVGVRCAAGHEPSCRDAVLLPAHPRQRYPTIWGPRILSPGSNRESWWRFAQLGPFENAILADMVRSLGPDRFRQFWSSALPVEDAFRAAAGQELGAWTREWAARTYAVPAGRGPALPATGMGYAVVLMVVAGGGAAWATRRRQIT